MSVKQFFQDGTVSVGVIEGSYEGKPTKSYIVKNQKFNKQTNKYEDNPFWNITAIKSLHAAISKIIVDSVKVKDLSNHPNQIKPQYPNNQQKQVNPNQVAQELGNTDFDFSDDDPFA